MTYLRQKDELNDEFREQVRFLQCSATSFDEGYEGEARRLAAVMRLMLHDTNRSMSLMKQLGVKEQLRYLDTAEPIDQKNLVSTPGLAMMEFSASQDLARGCYIPRFQGKPPGLCDGPFIKFEQWWNEHVTKDDLGRLFSRRDFVLNVANRDGGTHVDPSLDSAYADLTRNNSMGWWLSTHTRETEIPFEGNLAFVAIREIAFELDQSLHRDLLHLLDSASVKLGRLAEEAVGRNDLCPCGNGLKYKKCHGK